MKIVCDQCNTKYSIADAKIKNKVFKIRCKKCHHIILVNSQEKSSAAGQGFDDEKETVVVNYNGTGKEPASDITPVSESAPDSKIWYTVIDKEQVGPMTEEDLFEKFQNQLIDEKSYVWNETMSDWIRLKNVDKLHYFFDSHIDKTVVEQSPLEMEESAPVPTIQAPEKYELPSFTDFSPPAPGQPSSVEAATGLEETMVQDLKPQMIKTEIHADKPISQYNFPQAQILKPDKEPKIEVAPFVFKKEEVAASRFDPEVFREEPILKPEEQPLDKPKKFTAERHEDSVLFSLNTLSTLKPTKESEKDEKQAAKTGPIDRTKEASDLIDIKKLVKGDAAEALTAGKEMSGEIELPNVATPFLNISAPKRAATHLYYLIGGIGLVVVVGVVMILYNISSLQNKKKEDPQIVKVIERPAEKGDSSDKLKVLEEKLKVLEKDKELKKESDAKKAKKEKDEEGLETEKEKNKEKEAAKKEETKLAAKNPPVEPKRATLPPRVDTKVPPVVGKTVVVPQKTDKEKVGDEYEKVLKDISKEPKKTEPIDPAISKLPKTLTKSEVFSVIRANYSKVLGCAGSEKGNIIVSFNIVGSGGVAGVSVRSSSVSGTVMSCVKNIVSSDFRFPQFNGTPIPINVPFDLNP